jgi:hypothetical protein
MGPALLPRTAMRVFRRLGIAERPISKSRSIRTASPPRGQIASIHHLGATGGTIISKCIASMRDVYFLSEIHPFRANAPQFDPMAVAAQFQAQYGALSRNEMQTAFLAQMEIVARCVERQRGYLVLRDHAHTDFCAQGGGLAPIMLSTLSEGGYRMNAVVTIRDPVESYVSMLSNRWRELDFDSYCERWLAFLDSYSDRPVYRYEDFCDNPEKEITRMCVDLHIPFDANFRAGIPKQRLTGDSGRRSDEIGVRPAKAISPELSQEIGRSQAYARILRGWPEYERDLR